MAEYHIRWDPTNKKWELSIDGAAFVDLVERPLIEFLTANGITVPAVSPVGSARIYYDSVLKKFLVSEDGTAYKLLSGSVPPPAELFAIGYVGTANTAGNEIVLPAARIRDGDQLLLTWEETISAGTLVPTFKINGTTVSFTHGTICAGHSAGVKVVRVSSITVRLSFFLYCVAANAMYPQAPLEVGVPNLDLYPLKLQVTSVANKTIKGYRLFTYLIV